MKYYKPYPELPDPWTVGTEWNLEYGMLHYGLNKNTGFETARVATYEEALQKIKTKIGETNSGETSSS